MAINRQDRFGFENISAIDDIEQYINTNYLQVIENKISTLRLKRKEIEDKIDLYISINTANNLLIEELKSNTKYTTILNNQTVTKPLINELNIILRSLNTLLLYKDVITLNNLEYKKDLYSTGKVSITDGEFNKLQIENNTILNSLTIINEAPNITTNCNAYINALNVNKALLTTIFNSKAQITTLLVRPTLRTVLPTNKSAVNKVFVYQEALKYSLPLPTPNTRLYVNREGTDLMWV